MSESTAMSELANESTAMSELASDSAAHGLAERQAGLVAALVAAGPVPAGLDPARVAATRRALLRKRAGLAARQWPLLAAALGERWVQAFGAVHAASPPTDALREGWDVARAVRAELTGGAARELAARERTLRYDGHGPPRTRRIAGLRWRRPRNRPAPT